VQYRTFNTQASNIILLPFDVILNVFIVPETDDIVAGVLKYNLPEYNRNTNHSYRNTTVLGTRRKFT
jgi:hypothetical protein